MSRVKADYKVVVKQESRFEVANGPSYDETEHGPEVVVTKELDDFQKSFINLRGIKRILHK